jgi:large subunit ribosomal protein L25
MAQQLSLNIERRDGGGSTKARALRKSGKVPGVLYGHGSSESIAIDRRAFDDLLHHVGRNGLVELRLGGKKFDTALLREVQIDPVSRRAIHIDLQRVSANETVHAKLPVVTTGTPDGVRNFGGVMDVIVHELEIEGPANKLPDHLEVDVTDLGIHEHVTAGGVRLPAGFKLVTSAESIIVTVEASKTARALEEAEAAGAAPLEEAQPELVRESETPEGSRE